MKGIFGTITVIAAVTIGACGGGGGGGQPPLTARYLQLISAVNAKNLSNTMSHYSTLYYNDCSTWQDVQSGWQAIFNEPNYTLTLSDLDVTTEWTNNQTGTGHLEGTVTVTENINGNITSETWPISMPFRREGSAWRLFGDQSCPAGAADAKRQLRSYFGARQRQ